MFLAILLGPSIPAGIGIGMMSAREWQMGKRGARRGKGKRREGGKEGRRQGGEKGKGGKEGIQKVLFPLPGGRRNRRKFILKIGYLPLLQGNKRVIV